MTTSKRLKKSVHAEDERKRRRHSVPRSSPKIKASPCRTPPRSADLLLATPTAPNNLPLSKSPSQTPLDSNRENQRELLSASVATPNAPARKRISARSPDWLRIIMTTISKESALEMLNKRDEYERTGLDELVYVEWPQWNPTTWELLQSECSWMHLFLIAARYASITVIEEIMSKLSASRLTYLVNEYDQNALSALCSQPPADVLVFEPRQYRPAALRILDNNSAADIDLGGAKSTTVLDSFMQAAERRQEEMGIIAALLLQAKIDPTKPDSFGLSALDYAQRYTHHSILNELDRKINSNWLTSKNCQLTNQQNSELATPFLDLAEEGTPSVKLSEEEERYEVEVMTPISADAGFAEQFDPAYLFGNLPVMVSIKRNHHLKEAGGGDSSFDDDNSRGFCRASTTLDTEVGTGVETPRGISPGAEMIEDDPIVFQSCASNLPTACELTSQKRRGKRLQYASDKNLYAGLNDLHDIIASAAEKRAC